MTSPLRVMIFTQGSTFLSSDLTLCTFCVGVGAFPASWLLKLGSLLPHGLAAYNIFMMAWWDLGIPWKSALFLHSYNRLAAHVCVLCFLPDLLCLGPVILQSA